MSMRCPRALPHQPTATLATANGPVPWADWVNMLTIRGIAVTFGDRRSAGRSPAVVDSDPDPDSGLSRHYPKPDTRPVPSVVIPAHNEATVIGRLLAGLLADAQPGEFDVIVVPNGCTDGTAAVAEKFGSAVTVVSTDIPSKYQALRLGDRYAT